MVFPALPLAAAIWEMHKGGPPDSFANAHGDQSPDATAARNRISQIAADGPGLQYQGSKIGPDQYKNPANLGNLYDRIQKMDPGAVAELHGMWEKFRDKLDHGNATFGPQIQKAIAEKWRGNAAQQTAAALANFTNEDKHLVSSAQTVAEKVKLVRSAVDISKPGAQPTPHSSWLSDMAGWVPGPTWKTNDHRKTEANTANEHLVNSVLYPAIRESDTQVPLAPQPTNPVQGPGPGGVQPSAGPPGSTAPTPGHAGPEQSPGQQHSPQPGAGGNDPTAAGQPHDGTGQPPHPADTAPAGVDPNANPASSVTPAAASSGANPNTGLPNSASEMGPGRIGSGPGGSTSGGSTPDGAIPGGVGSGGIGSGATGSGRSGTPGGATRGGPGSSIPGRAGAGSTTGRSVPGASGRGGTGGVPGMAPPTAKSKKDEEKTHKSAISDALVTKEHGDELTGLGEDQRPKTIPPVLGNNP